MKTGRLFWVSLLAALAVAGVLVAFYMLFAEQRYEGALIAAVLLLGIAQLASVTFRQTESVVSKEDIAALRSAHDSAFHEAAGLRARVEAVERKLEAPRNERNKLLDEFHKVRRDFHDMTTAYLAPPEAVPAAAPVQSAKPTLNDEQLDLYLEPIIATATNTTSHYRAWLWLRAGGDRRAGSEDLYVKAERGGLRPALDVFALTRALPVLRRLSSKGREVSIFVPIGKATLAAPAYVAEMIRLLGDAPDIVHQVTLEVEQSAFAELTDAGIQGLAQFARSGATLGLGGAAASGIEFAALKSLGFRSIEFTAGLADGVPVWRNAARIAASQGIEVMVGGVETAEQADAVRRWAKYVSGPHFATPRLVKSDVGLEPICARAA